MHVVFPIESSSIEEEICRICFNDTYKHNKDGVSKTLELEEQKILQQLKVPIPSNELKRLRSLRETGILDSPAEEDYDRYTSLARRYFHTPIALVSLVDLSRQWFKSNMGLSNTSETSRDLAFCSYTVLESSPDIFIVPNAEDSSS